METLSIAQMVLFVAALSNSPDGDHDNDERRKKKKGLDANLMRSFPWKYLFLLAM